MRLRPATVGTARASAGDSSPGRAASRRPLAHTVRLMITPGMAREATACHMAVSATEAARGSRGERCSRADPAATLTAAGRAVAAEAEATSRKAAESAQACITP